MSKLVSFSTLLLLQVSAACETGDSSPSPSDGSSEMTVEAAEVDAAVQATIDAMTSSVRSGDLDGILETYTEDAVVVFDPGVPVYDRAAQRAAFEGFIAVSPVFEFDGHETVASGDHALHINPWAMKGRTPDGQVLEAGGLSVVVLERQADASWLMAIDNPHGSRLLPDLLIPAPSEVMPHPEERAVAETIDAMTSSFRAKDLEGIMATYVDGAAIVFEPGARALTDPDAQRQAFRAFFDADPTFEFGGHEVVVAGDSAVHINPWSMTGTGPDGAPIESSGLSVAVLERQPDGSWLMVIDHPYGNQLLAGA